MSDDGAGESRRSHIWMLNAYILFYGANRHLSRLSGYEAGAQTV